MSTIEHNKKIQKVRTELEMRMALNDFISQKYALHIPPQVEDADMVLHDAIEELLEAREKLARQQIPQIPIITTYAELAEAQRNGRQVVFMGDPSDTMQDIVKLAGKGKRDE